MDAMMVVVTVLCTVVGAGVGFFVRHTKAAAELKERQGKADEIIEKAKKDAGDLKYKAKKEAKEEMQEEREQFDKELKKLREEMKDQEKDLTKREANFESKQENHEKELAKHELKKAELEKEKEKVLIEVGKYKQRQTEIAEKLAEVAGLTREQAKAELMKAMEDEARVDFAKELHRIEEEYKEEAEQKSKRILSIAMERFAGEYVAEKTITSVELPSEDVKGRLIGREGRNIRAFEQICGVDLIIDDTPEIVVISSFNVVRREIARQTILKLIADGRIHPAKIEEFHDKSKADMEKQLRELGEKAQMEIGVHGMHPEVLKMIGALNWRTSYTQNQYQHSLEVAMLCGTMAAEFGLNVKQARRAGLLHDIGKAMDASAEGSHAVVGADFIQKYGEHPDVIHAVRAHHHDVKPDSVLAHLVIAADAISGARPGVRKAMMESYVSRLTDIEAIVNTFEGVSKTYAISGGREVRVLVEASKVDDEGTVMLSREISKKIEKEMTYPGSIKVTVLRETKAVGIAR
jgi:ribonucrease Y